MPPGMEEERFVMRYEDISGRRHDTAEQAVRANVRRWRKREIRQIVGYLALGAWLIALGVNPVITLVTTGIFTGVIAFSELLK